MTDTQTNLVVPGAFITMLQSLLRHLLGGVSSVLVANGAAVDQVENIVLGVAGLIATLAWSFVDKKILNRQPATPKGE